MRNSFDINIPCSAFPPLAIIVLLACVSGAVAADGAVVRGHIVDPRGDGHAEGRPLLFVTEDGQKLTLVGDEYATSQLADPRLKGRHWELQGRRKSEGVFEVLRLFTIKAGKLYRVTYFCIICNIRSHLAGDCMCCQEETEVQELPVAEL